MFSEHEKQYGDLQNLLPNLNEILRNFQNSLIFSKADEFFIIQFIFSVHSLIFSQLAPPGAHAVPERRALAPLRALGPRAVAGRRAGGLLSPLGWAQGLILFFPLLLMFFFISKEGEVKKNKKTPLL